LFNLFGTAVGAGVLYLPITAGRVGFVSLLLIAFLVVPVIFFSHRNMTRFCLEAPRLDANITVTMNDTEHLIQMPLRNQIERYTHQNNDQRHNQRLHRGQHQMLTLAENSRQH
jgi:maltodextrin utilization protein YvdJ